MLFTNLPMNTKIGGVGIFVNKNLNVTVCNNLLITSSNDCKGIYGWK